MSRWFRFAVPLVVGLTTALTCGCGKKANLYPVTGTVMVKGKPAEHAIVFLHRKGKSDMTEQVPFGKAGPDGKFNISTPTVGDGAVPGEYVVTVYWPDMSKPEDGNGGRPDALNGAYDKVGQSKINATVEAKPNTLAQLNLTPGAPQGKIVDKNDK